MNQSSHKWYLTNNMLMVNDKEPKMLGLASKENRGKGFSLPIQQEGQVRTEYVKPGVKIFLL